ncbi:dihydropteroate synthase [Lacisediminihabitans changchengi]|uniref:Dihydropteroate synthase n=1 Tax=Lacisediminihabitans changchengi TaxID=2787634 RepID=A0A934VYM7_9MICO|nr:dihydropteroate synthase [Lacisediminihabitans changchengi]MBK4348212.1 dihydropteroate synthase [Lacisediminihabitans changchengi]
MTSRAIGARSFDFDRQVAVMAIVNRTPDSFFDRGSTFALDAAVERSLAAVDAGADWVDVGGVPFGRGPAVSVQQELDRVIPVVEAIRAASDVVVSVDTFSAEVARQSILAGAGVINDTSGLWDVDMAPVVAASAATLVLTHSLAPPRSEPPRPEYTDVTADVIAFLENRVARATAAGIPLERLIVDPGHDLNKNTYHSLELTARLEEVVAIGLPTLVAVSNKDFIGETLDRARGERLEGSIAAAVICIMKGARIIRMHDVRAAVAAARMTEAVLGLREPAYAIHNRE